MFVFCVFSASPSFSTLGLSPYKSLPQGHPRQPPFPSTPASNLEDIGRGGNKQEVGVDTHSLKPQSPELLYKPWPQRGSILLGGDPSPLLC